LQYLAKETHTNTYTSTVSDPGGMLTGLAVFLALVGAVVFVVARRRTGP
jgi:hypothetical protein